MKRALLTRASSIARESGAVRVSWERERIAATRAGVGRWRGLAGLSTELHVAEQDGGEEPKLDRHRPTVRFLTGVAAQGHPEKTDKHMHGEDAFFISTTHNAFGVADGVSQWVDIDVDAGAYSRLLMERCLIEVQKLAEENKESDEPVMPKVVLERAYRDTLSTMGSATACLVSLTGQGVLHAANLGDSGFLVVRCGALREKSFSAQDLNKSPAPRPLHWDLVYRSNDMQKFFNCPDQLGPGCPDKPARAETFSLPVLPGDLVITATDGLFDNLSDTDICIIIKRLSSQVKDLFPENNFQVAHEGMDKSEALSAWLRQIAQTLVDQAMEIGRSESAKTPFRKTAMRAGYVFEGGKLDDTVCTIGLVVAKDH